MHRRGFMRSLALGSAAAGTLAPGAFARALEVAGAAEYVGLAPDVVARDESFWLAIQRAFPVDRSIINLNHGGVSPVLGAALEAQKRYLDYENGAPPYTMWRILEPQKENVRKGLARIFGSDPEEIAITRNASESLETCQLGIDLEPGDQVLTTNQDYPRMMNTWKQLVRRRGVEIKQCSIPVPAEDEAEIVRRFEEQVTPKTRVILMSHMINLTGQIMPVRGVSRMARQKGIQLIVDGAHTFAHFPFKQEDLECDYFGTSLHKWLFAPHGTGLLYVRRDRIEKLWPLMPGSAEQDKDIRKFEEIGTHPAATFLAISESILFHEGIGAERKAARLRYLKSYWADRLSKHDRVRLNMSMDPRFSCGLGNFRIEGIDSSELGNALWRDKILTTTIKHEEFEGVRVTPSLSTTLPELDRFCEAVEAILKNGLPKS